MCAESVSQRFLKQAILETALDQAGFLGVEPNFLHPNLRKNIGLLFSPDARRIPDEETQMFFSLLNNLLHLFDQEHSQPNVSKELRSKLIAVVVQDALVALHSVASNSVVEALSISRHLQQADRSTTSTGGGSSAGDSSAGQEQVPESSVHDRALAALLPHLSARSGGEQQYIMPRISLSSGRRRLRFFSSFV